MHKKNNLEGEEEARGGHEQTQMKRKKTVAGANRTHCLLLYTFVVWTTERVYAYVRTSSTHHSRINFVFQKFNAFDVYGGQAAVQCTNIFLHMLRYNQAYINYTYLH